MDDAQEQLMWFLQTIWEDGSNLFLLGLTNVVDEIERLVQSEPKAKAMHSSYISDQISDLSVLAEAMRQVNNYQPWAATFEDSLVEKEKGVMDKFTVKSANWAALMPPSEKLPHGDLVRLGKLEGSKLYYPAEKRRTKENVEAMRSAEAQLDAFWAAVDERVRSRLGNKLKETALWRFLSKAKVLRRTPEWTDVHQATKPSEVEEITQPLSGLHFERELRTERTIDRTKRSVPVSAMTKTKGIPAPSASKDNHVANPTSGKADHQPTFRLDTRAYKVFRSLFYVPSLSVTPGQVPWTDFLHAMVCTGFEPQNLYGSVWLFSPKRLDVERSIQFHEPHPLKKLPYKMARRFGRRLNRAYGWEYSMFMLKD